VSPAPILPGNGSVSLSSPAPLAAPPEPESEPAFLNLPYFSSFFFVRLPIFTSRNSSILQVYLI